MINKKITNFVLITLICFYVYASPNMVKVSSKNYCFGDDSYTFEEIEVSKYKISIEEWEEYLRFNNSNLIDRYEHEVRRIIDSLQEEIIQSWPAFGVTFAEVAEYCNWLSEKENLQKCYRITIDNNKNKCIETDYSANGYRLPTVSEWFYLSELWMNKEADYYKEVNILNREVDINHQIPYSIYEEKENSLGIYDPVGNIPELCNSYFNERYTIKDYLKDTYGPKTYTPDPDQIYFREPLTEVRWKLGGDFGSEIEYIKQKNGLLYPVNILSTDFASFRVVKRAN